MKNIVRIVAVVVFAAFAVALAGGAVSPAHAQQANAVCGSCRGTGNGVFACGSCKGTGKSGNFRCNTCMGSGFQKCVTCRGTGRK